jgi:hypothetical protein
MPPTHVTPVFGWVYVLVNKAMPDLAKIGFTLRRIEERVAAYTALPSPFVCAFRCQAERPEEIEAKVHAHLKERNHGKGFFRISPIEAAIAIDDVAKQMQITTAHGWLNPRYRNEKTNQGAGPDPRPGIASYAT